MLEKISYVFSKFNNRIIFLLLAKQAMLSCHVPSDAHVAEILIEELTHGRSQVPFR